MTRKVIKGALSMIVAFAACSRPATKDEALGAYAMNKGKAHDTLIVYPNGAYARRHKAPGAEIVVDSGRWTWDTTKNGTVSHIRELHSEVERRVISADSSHPGFLARQAGTKI